MEPFKKVFCAVDLGPEANDVLRQASELAQGPGATLLVLHAVTAPPRNDPLFPNLYSSAWAELSALQARLQETLVERVRAATGRGTDAFRVQVTDGTPYATIVERAEAWGADVIVLGSCGTTGVARALLGSVAERVVRFSHGPVLVTRPGPRTGWVLAATDLSDPSWPAVAAAGVEARRRGARVTLVHSLDTMMQTVWAAGTAVVIPFRPSPEARAEAFKTADERLQKALSRTGAEGETAVLEGPPAADIVRLAGELPAELVVVGTAGRTGLRRTLLGSVAEAVVRDAPCSVLVVRLRNAS
jgi:nucleotide-binding universal stress UspA family protein